MAACVSYVYFESYPVGHFNRLFESFPVCFYVVSSYIYLITDYTTLLFEKSTMESKIIVNKYMDNGHWQYPKVIDPDDWFGFIYRIVELSSGKNYIGKKQFWAMTRKKIKNRKNRKKIIREGKWRVYTGSSKALNAAITEHGMDNYTFTIESLHTTKGSLFYAEVEKQVKENVLREKLEDGTPKYYNRQIAGVRFIPAEPTEAEILSENKGG